jgi:hypothetical protein
MVEALVDGIDTLTFGHDRLLVKLFDGFELFVCENRSIAWMLRQVGAFSEADIVDLAIAFIAQKMKETTVWVEVPCRVKADGTAGKGRIDMVVSLPGQQRLLLIKFKAFAPPALGLAESLADRIRFAEIGNNPARVAWKSMGEKYLLDTPANELNRQLTPSQCRAQFAAIRHCTSQTEQPRFVQHSVRQIELDAQIQLKHFMTSVAKFDFGPSSPVKRGQNAVIGLVVILVGFNLVVSQVEL